MNSASAAADATQTRNPKTPAQASKMPSRTSHAYQTRNPSLPSNQTQAAPCSTRSEAHQTQAAPSRVRRGIPKVGPDGWPPRRFKAGEQFQGTVTTAEAAAILGITPGRLRAAASSWGLVPFAYGPGGIVTYWRRYVERLAVARQSLN